MADRNDIIPLLHPEHRKPVKAAIFLSGSGTNAEKLLHAAELRGLCEFTVLVSDRSGNRRLEELAAEFSLPAVVLDLKTFYREHGEESTALTSPRRWELRTQWSRELWQSVAPYRPDFGIFAGFAVLSDLAGFLPCINVHPGDLTVEEEGKRIYAGLHCEPVERALLRGDSSLRSSVILIQSFKESSGVEVDGGPILGLSPAVPADTGGHTLEELRQLAAQRTAPPYRDALRELALQNIEHLKTAGDHVVLPAVVRELASGNYALDRQKNLLHRENGVWTRRRAIVYTEEGQPLPARPARKKGGRLRRTLYFLYYRVVRGSGTPEFIARGWALGVAVGCIVPVFCQLAVAIPLSFVCRGSRIGAITGTFVTTPPTAIFIYPIQIWIGSLLIGADLSFSAVKNASDLMLKKGDFAAFANMGREMICAFFAGGLLWALWMVPLTYLLVRKLVKSYRQAQQRKKQKGLKP